MLLYIIRHGDPIYFPDSLTKRGHLQAEALAKRLATYGLDKIYSSPNFRAQETAKPTSVLTGIEVEIEDWTSEDLAWDDFSINENGTSNWIYATDLQTEIRSPEVINLGERWYEAEVFSKINAKEGNFRIKNASDEFLARHGYLHDGYKYKQVNPNDERIAVFCHQGFGLSWIASILDLPMPIAWANFDVTHTGMSVIEFKNNGKQYTNAKMLTLSNDSHLYREGLPCKYNNSLYI